MSSWRDLPPALQRRSWLAEQAGDYAALTFQPPPRRHRTSCGETTTRRVCTFAADPRGISGLPLTSPWAGGSAGPVESTPRSASTCPPTGVHPARWCMEASMFQRSLVWVQNNKALVVGGAMSLFSASLTLGALL